MIHQSDIMESTYINNKPKAIIIAFHAGCFVGGKHTYDVKQNKALCSMEYSVYQPEFPKTLNLNNGHVVTC